MPDGEAELGPGFQELRAQAAYDERLAGLGIPQELHKGVGDKLREISKDLKELDPSSEAFQARHDTLALLEAELVLAGHEQQETTLRVELSKMAIDPVNRNVLVAETGQLRATIKEKAGRLPAYVKAYNDTVDTIGTLRQEINKTNPEKKAKDPNSGLLKAVELYRGAFVSSHPDYSRLHPPFEVKT